MKSHEKSWNFISWSKYFVLFENWKHSPCHRAKLCPQKAGFSAFLSHRKFKLVIEKSSDFIIQFLCEPRLAFYNIPETTLLCVLKLDWKLVLLVVLM